MKKIFNYALLAAALLVGVNVNAGNVVEVTMGEETIGYETFSAALKAIYDAAKLNVAPAKTEATIKLIADVPTVTYDAAWMNDARGQWAGTNTDRIDLNEGEYITIDLNNFTLNLGLRFNLQRAGISFTGKGNVVATASQVVTLYGDNDHKDAESGYSYLLIDKDVVLTFNAIYGPSTYYKSAYGEYYSGILMDIKGQVIAGVDDANGMSTSGNMKMKADELNIPIVNIYPGAIVRGANNLKEVGTTDSNDEAFRKAHPEIDFTTYRTTSAGIYSPGVAELNIQGTIEGGIGIYAKAGYLHLNDATIKATAAGYHKPYAYSNGFYGAGSAIVFDSNAGYADDMSVDISGNTNVSSTTGYAVEELVTSGTGHMSGEDFVINSGTFTGGSEGCLSVTAELGEDVKVNGTVTGGTYNGDVTNIISNVDGIITPITNPDGTTSYIVATKEPTQVWKNDITTAEAGDYVEISGTYDKTLTNDIEAAYLVAKNTAKVTIPTGKTLEVGEIVLDKDAQIVVEKGAKLIVEGTKGIVANQATNIVLKSEEGAPAYFLLDPQVTSNKTPKATVNFVANSFAEAGGAYQYQYFGAPMVGGAIEKIEPIDFTGKTLFLSWNKTAWETIGTIDNGVESMDYSKFNTPFGFYALCAVAPQGSKQTYAITGNLYGNTNPQIKVLNNYTALSNGFTGDMGFEAMLAALGVVSIQQNVWIPKTDEDSELQWIVYNKVRDSEDIHPMGTFMVKNDAASANLDLNYENIVWEPATKDEVPNSAPKANNFAKATVRVNGCGLNDIVTVAEDDQFSADFDNGYDAEKYENTKIRFYVNADKEYDIFATDNVNNTFVGLMTTKAGKYTISFEDVTANFALVDTKTNARIEMSEGNTYEFLAEAGEDAYRFQIVEAAKAPTNTPATKAAVKATKALINDQIVINNGERFFNMLGTDVK